MATFRDELTGLQRRLRQLHRELRREDPVGAEWIAIGAGSIGDALKALPRAALRREMPAAPVNERPAPVNAPAPPVNAPPAPPPVQKAELRYSVDSTPRVLRVPPRVYSCGICRQPGHTAKSHDRHAAAASSPAPDPSGDEDPEPARSDSNGATSVPAAPAAQPPPASDGAGPDDATTGETDPAPGRGDLLADQGAARAYIALRPAPPPSTAALPVFRPPMRRQNRNMPTSRAL